MNASGEERRARAAAEAATWAERLEDGPLTGAERSELTDWLRESPLHVAEMLASGRLSSALQRFPHWKALAPPAAASARGAEGPDDGRRTSFGASPIGTVSPKVRSPGRSTRNPAARWAAGLAAGVAIAAIAVWFMRGDPRVTALNTQPGERRQITLADGSLVRLMSDTDLRVQMQPHLRTVRILRGEALFRVAKDPARPFVVDVETTRVRAVGTIFSVERRVDGVVVTVAEGKVAVRPGGAGAPGAADSTAGSEVPLEANERLVVSALGIASAVHRVEPAPDVDPSDPFQVRSHRLSFENARVADVVAQFNRRNRLQIEISDPALAARTVSGIFDSDDPQSFVDFLRSTSSATTSRVRDESAVRLVATPRAATSQRP